MKTFLSVRPVKNSRCQNPKIIKRNSKVFQKRVKEEREKKREIVVVMGVGFVGAVMAAIVADTVDKKRTAFEICDRNAASQRTKFLEDPIA